jgi:hypothetical protein
VAGASVFTADDPAAMIDTLRSVATRHAHLVG